MIVLVIALKKQKVWLTRLSLLGMGIVVLLLVVFQYRDYQRFEDYLQKGTDSEFFQGPCIRFKETLS